MEKTVDAWLAKTGGIPFDPGCEDVEDHELGVKDLNAHMGHVDKADGHTEVYILQRSKIEHFLDTTIVNSFVIFSCLAVGNPLTLEDFRRSVSKALLGVPRGETMGKRNSLTFTNKLKPKFPTEI
ncbi:hypothetical protein J6590_073106 [Homalodisca vitripennis]|nr:hypothetical protein J6590_073106 [Homalodisca vitripennis]